MPAVEALRLELERPTATGLEYLECLDYDSFVKWLSWKLKKPQEIKYISWKGVQTSSGTRNLLQRRLHHKFDDWKTMTNSNSSNKNTHLSNSATVPHPRARRFRADFIPLFMPLYFGILGSGFVLVWAKLGLCVGVLRCFLKGYLNLVKRFTRCGVSSSICFQNVHWIKHNWFENVIQNLWFL